MTQSRRHSFLEAWANTLWALFVSLLLGHFLFPAMGWELSLGQNITVTLVFTVVSIIRTYCGGGLLIGGNMGTCSRGKLWRKGEESGHVQRVVEIRLDCDADAVLLRVEQVGGIACHTGRERCFFRKLENGRWVSTDPVLKDPKLIYGEQ